MIDRIFVPLDGSELAEAAVPHARTLAEVFDAEVRLLRVIPPGRAGGLTHDAVEWRLDQADAARYLEGWCGRLRQSGTRVSSDVLEGEPATEILAALRQGEDDLVILTAHGRSGTTEHPLGGTAQKIVSGGGASILLVRPEPGREESAEYSRILAPVDGSPRGDWALCAAASIARVTGAELVMAHVLAAPERMPRPARESTGTLEDRFMERCRETAEAYLSERREQLSAPGLSIEVRIVRSGQVPAALHRLTSELGADLVVMSAHGRSGAAPWPYGSVAGNLLTYGRAPVLVLQDQPCAPGDAGADPGRDEHRRRPVAGVPELGAVPS